MSAFQYSQNFVFAGLGTLSFEVPDAGPFFVDVKSTIPTLTAGGGISALVITINLNGSPVYTGAAGAQGAYVVFSVAAKDVITVVFSSAAIPDQGLNVIKSTISVGYGE